MLTPATCLPGPIVVPGLNMPLPLSVSILTGPTTFHVPSANFWNEPQGALSDSAYPSAGDKVLKATMVAKMMIDLIIARPRLSLLVNQNHSLISSPIGVAPCGIRNTPFHRSHWFAQDTGPCRSPDHQW